MLVASKGGFALPKSEGRCKTGDNSLVSPSPKSRQFYGVEGCDAPEPSGYSTPSLLNSPGALPRVREPPIGTFSGCENAGC